MSATDLRKLKSISSVTEEISSSMKIMKMKSESDISSPSRDTVQSLRPRTKSLTLDDRNSDSSDLSKKLRDSDSLSLKLSSSFDSDEVTKNTKRGDNTMNNCQKYPREVQMSDTFIIETDKDGDSHQMLPSTSDTVLLDVNENEASMGKGHESDKIAPTPTPTSSYCSYTTCLTSITTAGRKDFYRTTSGNIRTRGLNEVESQAILITPEPGKTFVPETQASDTDKSPEEIPNSPDPPAKRRKKVSQLGSVSQENGECPLCGRQMRIKVLEGHALYCNGSNRSNLTRWVLSFCDIQQAVRCYLLTQNLQERRKEEA